MKTKLLILFIALPCLGIAQEKWDLKKSENGITVYTRKLDNEKFKEIRVVCEFKATAAQLIKILQNVDHHKDWVYSTKRSHLISRKSKDTLFYYSETSLPWPLSNRDVAVRLSFANDTIHKILKIEALSTAGIIPVNKGIVRIPYSLGLWAVNTSANDRLKIEYTFSVNPGGAVPTWLVNSMATAGPYNTFKNLKALIEQKSH